jgi:hypothetical protein
MSGVKGVIALFLDKDGNEIAHSASFEVVSYSGFSLKESQKIIAKKLLLKNIAEVFFYGDFSKQISNHTLECVLRDLSVKNKIEYYYIGYEND